MPGVTSWGEQLEGERHPAPRIPAAKIANRITFEIRSTATVEIIRPGGVGKHGDFRRLVRVIEWDDWVFFPGPLGHTPSGRSFPKVRRGVPNLRMRHARVIGLKDRGPFWWLAALGLIVLGRATRTSRFHLRLRRPTQCGTRI